MLTFAQFLDKAAREGELVNVIFEERFFDLIQTRHRLTSVLEAENIAHVLVGGLAVLVYVEEVSPECSALTRGVDLLVRRKDLDHINQVTSNIVASRAHVHLHLTDDDEIDFQRKRIPDVDVRVIPVAELVGMKLTSFRLKDQVHVKTLDTVGLITQEIENSLQPELQARLKYVRETE